MTSVGSQIPYGFILLLFSVLPTVVHANQKCVDVEGFVKCNEDPSRASSVHISVYDQDGMNDFFRYFDPDDLMAETLTDQLGHFQLTGCASDFNWFWLPNDPDPQVRIRHNCSGRVKEIWLSTFYEFQPSRHYVGILILDDANEDEPDNNEVVREQVSNDREALMSFFNTRLNERRHPSLSRRAVEHLDSNQKISQDQPIDEHRGSGEEF